MDQTGQTHTRRRGLGLVLLLGAMFFGSVAGARYWVHRAQPATSEALWFEARDQAPGASFAPAPLDAVSLRKLATTNVVNGQFTNDARLQCTVFMASWDHTKGEQVLAVDHTPDLCWAHVGWRPLDLGQPKEVHIDFGGVSLPFECRVFESAGGNRRELVVWCSLLGGRVMPELDILRLSAQESTGEYNDHAQRSVQVRRRLKLAQFWASITQGVPHRGTRQFVRYSVPVTSDWASAIEQVTEFGPRWLKLRQDRP